MEKKSIEISQVAASETERAQTESAMVTWLEMWCFGYDITIPEYSQSDLKSSGIEGDTPVDQVVWDLIISRVVVLGSGQ